MTKLSPWTPGDPLTREAVVARLDELGWSNGYRLEEFNHRHVLVTLASVFDPYVVLSLDDGHEVVSYRSLDGAREAFRVIRDAP